jgi:hypothetical protein
MRFIWLSAFLLASAPALAADDAASGSANPPKERKICKRLDATESRMAAQRVCKTAAQWKRDKDAGVDEDSKGSVSTRSQ